MECAIPVYGVWAMHGAHAGRWLPTLARALMVSAIYGTVLIAALLALGFALIATS